MVTWLVHLDNNGIKMNTKLSLFFTLFVIYLFIYFV